QGSRYNVVRVFLNDSKIGGNLSSPGLDPAYMGNVTDFIKRASNFGLRVILTGGSIPNGYFPYRIVAPTLKGVDGVNLVILDPVYIEANRRYWIDIVNFIRAKDLQLLTAVFSYDVINEPVFLTDSAPFSLTSGTVTLPGVGKFDLSDP